MYQFDGQVSILDSLLLLTSLFLSKLVYLAERTYLNQSPPVGLVNHEEFALICFGRCTKLEGHEALESNYADLIDVSQGPCKLQCIVVSTGACPLIIIFHPDSA